MSFKIQALLLAAGITLAACAMPAHRTPQTSETIISSSAVVQAVNPQTRQVTLKDAADGQSFTVVAGPEVRNLDQLAAGDTVVLDYYQATTVAMAEPGTIPQTTTAVGAARAPAGAKPGALAVASTTTTVRVVSYDNASGLATFVTPDGLTRRATVPPELRTFAAARGRGSLVDVTFTDAFAVSIAEQPAQ